MSVPDSQGPRPAFNPRPLPRPRRSSASVEVPRVLLGLLGGALLVAIVAIAFLVGRQSGLRRTEAAQGVAPAESPVGGVAGTEGVAVEAPPTQSYGGSAQPAPWRPQDAPPNTAPAPAATPNSTPAASQGGPERTAVATYFAQIEAYERQAKYWDDPKQLAMSLVTEGTNGESKGMDKLLNAQRTALVQIMTITVPPLCREHHRRTVALMERAVKLLETIKASLGSGDFEGLLTLTTAANQLANQTREVDALAAKIKTQVGLPTT